MKNQDSGKVLQCNEPEQQLLKSAPKRRHIGRGSPQQSDKEENQAKSEGPKTVFYVYPRRKGVSTQ
ncbi:hypothetical protein TRIATDRAFT_254287 [Trichoderma atroviride IMI 206040]|uniref:Uncharacterized protein n=1 Tax=Hypocrea atroviridis (strain ATCC 20476 / IMI 206040) TaxID=452589 RepID=G9NF37_HYPAI|nr:uncharacterized protein TRIATDRAFT_254287 [Trichoderma atroviride IMI 206040]EHK50554.1 hypothetical protein TRIATDRAFT_254287 [Trichoderma atroviride IMI 206040]